MSDDFKPAATDHPAGPPPEPPVDLSAEVVMHMMAMAIEIAAGFRYLAAVLPMTAPLEGFAASIVRHVGDVGDLMRPPE